MSKQMLFVYQNRKSKKSISTEKRSSINKKEKLKQAIAATISVLIFLTARSIFQESKTKKRKERERYPKQKDVKTVLTTNYSVV